MINDFFEPSLREIFGIDLEKPYSAADKNYLEIINKKWDYRTSFVNNMFKGQTCSFGKLLIINSDLTFSSAYCPQSRKIGIPLVYLSPEKIKEKITYNEKCRQSCCQIPTDLILDKKVNKKKRGSPYRGDPLLHIS